MSRSVLPEVLLLTLSVCFAFAGVHTHFFYVTVVSERTNDLPLYITTRMLDDITLLRYDSDNMVIERKVPWFKSPNSSLLAASLRYYSFQNYEVNLLRVISQSMGHTQGFHVLQILDGCTLYDNGTAKTFLSYHYDGKPFMYFNTETSHYIAETPEAEKFTEILNANKTVIEEDEEILNTCIRHITELLSLGKCTINRTEEPVIRVTQIRVDNVGVRLCCRAFGHYPKDIFMMWYKNGEQIMEQVMERVTLPLRDMTYLTSLSFMVPSVAGEIYTCKVAHSSMMENVTHELRISGDSENVSSAPSNPSRGAVIAICLAVILALVIIVFGLVSFSKNRRQ